LGECVFKFKIQSTKDMHTKAVIVMLINLLA